MQTKDNNLQIKDIDLAKSRVTGYFSEFHTKDSYGDVTKKGAFTKTINESGPQGAKLIRWCMNHDMSNKALGSFEELKEDDFGLFYVGKLGEMIWARELRHMVDCGINITHSYGYTTISEYKDKDINYLTEVKMYEGSCISTWAANPNTPLVSMTQGSKSLRERVREFNNSITPFIRYKTISEAPDEVIKSVEEYVSVQEAMFWEGVTEKRDDDDLQQKALIELELLKIRI